MELLSKVYNEFIKNITPGHFEGIICYLAGSITFTVLHIVYRERAIKAFAGKDGNLDGEDWLLYMASWLIPHVVMANLFLQMRPDTNVLIFFGVILLYCFTGKWGLKWLLAWKNPQSIPPNSDTNDQHP